MFGYNIMNDKKNQIKLAILKIKSYLCHIILTERIAPI